MVLTSRYINDVFNFVYLNPMSNVLMWHYKGNRGLADCSELGASRSPYFIIGCQRKGVLIASS